MKKINLFNNLFNVNKPYRYLEINKNLSRSAQPSIEEFEWLKSQGVTDVVDLCKNHIEYKPFNEKSVVEGCGMVYHNIPIYTSSPREDQVGRFLDIVDDVTRKNGRVHLHCKEGVDRTGMYSLIYKTVNGIGSFNDNLREMINMGFHYDCYADIIPWAENFINKLKK